MQDKKKKYAELVLTVGLNVVNGDKVYISAPAETYSFIQLLVEEAYELGASKVLVDFRDDVINRNKYLNENLENFETVNDFDIVKAEHLVENNFKLLSVSASDPNALNGVDNAKLAAYNKAYYNSCKKRVDYTMGNFGSWLVMSVPTKAWADVVFNNDENSVDLLWNEILKACRCDLENPIQAWREHIEKLNKVSKDLNEMQYDKLHFKNSLGTDLHVSLPKNHIWGAADSVNNTDQSLFVANMPTEEVFTMPHREKVFGKVYSSKPLVYNGSPIENFWLEFKDGEVIDYGAEVGIDVLETMLNMDDGAKRLGEVALVEFSSPINLSNILFYNTLFDENASCHLALGRSYPTNIENGVNLTEEELQAEGGNSSSIHVDFMFGTSDMNVIATKNNTEKMIFENGAFVN